jgi:hypothetical protein
VKSRYATDCDRSFQVKAKTFAAFDFLIAVFLNIGNFLTRRGRHQCLEGRQAAEFYTLPISFIREHHDKSSSSWEKARLKNAVIDQYRDDHGFELIAQALGIEYPSRSPASAVTT